MGGLMTALPMVFKVASVAAPVLSGFLGAAGQSQSAAASALNQQMQALNAQTQALSQAHNSQAQGLAAEQNALIQEQNAAEAKRAGALEAQNLAAAAYKTKARQRAALAESGLLNSGTGALLINETEANAAWDAKELDRQTALNVQGIMYQAGNYAREAKMHSVNADTAFGQANSYGQEAKSAMNYKPPSGLGSILGGIATGYGVYSGFNWGASGGNGWANTATKFIPKL